MRQKFLVYALFGMIASGSVMGAAIAYKDQIPSLLAQGPIRGGDQTDRNFIEMMIPHHQDAVEMAKLALTRAKRPELKKLAEAITQDQNREIKQMQAWYQAWFGKAVPPLSTSGMMGMHHGMMAMDLDGLKAATDFDREFIRQMIPHHQMAVMMASRLKTDTTRPEMDKLADDIIQSQSREIKQMKQWYESWYPR